MLYSIDLEIVNYRSFSRILFRNKESFESHGACLDRYGQGSFDRQDAAVKSKFADEHVLLHF